ncbi:MAG: hypothetical protein ACR5K9_03910 [Wolbachia sp.]
MREYQVATLPEEPPNIKQAIIWLGKLGGFMNRKSDRDYDSMAGLRKSQGEHSYASHNDLSKLWVKVRV